MVTIHYRRPPDRLEVFEQAVVEDDGECVVTYLPSAKVKKPMEIGGRVVLEPGSPIVWFTYRGDVWHDVGRFHLADGTLTGAYVNILTPVRMDGTVWETIDLFLDLFITPTGEIEVLDRDELLGAMDAGWIDDGIGLRVAAEMQDVLCRADDDTWPSNHVREWTLERVREVMEEGGGLTGG